MIGKFQICNKYDHQNLKIYINNLSFFISNFSKKKLEIYFKLLLYRKVFINISRVQWFLSNLINPYFCRSEPPRQRPLRQPPVLVLLGQWRSSAAKHRMGLVQRQELLQKALHGSRVLRDPAGVWVGQEQDGRSVKL